MENIKVEKEVFYDFAEEILRKEGYNYQKNIINDAKTYLKMDNDFYQGKGNEYSLVDGEGNKILVCSQLTRIKKIIGCSTLEDIEYEDNPYLTTEEIEELITKDFDQTNLFLLPEVFKTVAVKTNNTVIDQNLKMEILQEYISEIKKQNSRINKFVRKISKKSN